MKFFTSFPFVAALTSVLLSPQLAHAFITRIAGPTQTLHPDQKFNVTFFTEDYIQNNLQYYAIFGVSPVGGYSEPNLLGNLLGSGSDLVLSGHSNTGYGTYNITLTIPKPFSTPNGTTQSYFLKTAVLGTVRCSCRHRVACTGSSLAYKIGASGTALLLTFNTTISISPN
jgi:Nis1 family